MKRSAEESPIYPLNEILSNLASLKPEQFSTLFAKIESGEVSYDHTDLFGTTIMHIAYKFREYEAIVKLDSLDDSLYTKEDEDREKPADYFAEYTDAEKKALARAFERYKAQLDEARTQAEAAAIEAEASRAQQEEAVRQIAMIQSVAELTADAKAAGAFRSSAADTSLRGEPTPDIAHTDWTEVFAPGQATSRARQLL